MLPQVLKLERLAVDLLFPRWCLGCGREGDFLSPSCHHLLNRIPLPLCPLCGLPQINEVLCPTCVSWPAAIDGIRSPFRYEGLVCQAVHQFKYHNLRALAETLVGFLYEYLVLTPLPGEVITPVPLHGRRLRGRGYNQSRLLARGLSRLTGLPMKDNCLFRVRYELPQANTESVAERRRNVAAAFSCRNDNLRGKRVLLVDDVATSGATLNACAGALKAAGSTSVWGLVLAREV